MSVKLGIRRLFESLMRPQMADGKIFLSNEFSAEPYETFKCRWRGRQYGSFEELTTEIARLEDEGKIDIKKTAWAVVPAEMTEEEYQKVASSPELQKEHDRRYSLVTSLFRGEEAVYA